MAVPSSSSHRVLRHPAREQIDISNVVVNAAHGEEWLGSIDDAVALVRLPGVRGPTSWIEYFYPDRKRLGGGG